MRFPLHDKGGAQRCSSASLVWMGLLFASYDATAETVTLPVIGTTIHLELGDAAAAGERGD